MDCPRDGSIEDAASTVAISFVTTDLNWGHRIGYVTSSISAAWTSCAHLGQWRSYFALRNAAFNSSYLMRPDFFLGPIILHRPDCQNSLMEQDSGPYWLLWLWMTKQEQIWAGVWPVKFYTYFLNGASLVGRGLFVFKRLLLIVLLWLRVLIPRMHSCYLLAYA